MNFLAPHRAFVAIAAGLVLLFSPASQSAEPEKNSLEPAKPAPDGHRFLFVVETSADNRKSEDANRQAVFDLMVGGVYGHMRSGDTFGIWTFSDDVRAGEFPMTVYSSERALEIAGQVATFLKSKKYSRRPDYKPLIKQLRTLADAVADFNVFILSSGQQRMEGTPFDQNINAAFEAFKKRPAKLARLPLVTSFIVRKGRPSGGSVVLAGERIALPERPPSITPAPVTASNSPPAAVASNATNVSNPTVATANVTPTNSPPALPKVFQFVTHSNRPSPVTAAITNAVASDSTSNLPSTPPAAPDSAGTSAQPVSSNPSPTPIPTESDIPTRTIASTGTIFSDPAAAQRTATINSAPHSGPGPNPTNDRAAYSVTPISSILAASANSGSETPLRVAAREPASASPSTPPTESESSTTISSKTPAVAAVAVLPGPPIGLSPAALLAIGGTLLGATCLLVVLVLRRTPPPSRGSLISQSMRRE